MKTMFTLLVAGMLIASAASAQDSLKVFPVPNRSEGIITITYPEPIKMVILSDAAGNPVGRPVPFFATNPALPLPKLAAGVYIMKIFTTSSLFVRRIVIQ